MVPDEPLLDVRGLMVASFHHSAECNEESVCPITPLLDPTAKASRLVKFVRGVHEVGRERLLDRGNIPVVGLPSMMEASMTLACGPIQYSMDST